MNCTDLEILLCDYVDGTLSPAERATVELHLSACAACRDQVADARAAVEFMERVAEVEPPSELVNKILFEARSGKSAPVRRKGLGGWLGRLLEPVLQPKFAMGMAMTILSFSMLGRFAGVPVRQLKASDLEPAKVWATLEDKAYRTWDRAKKYYESLRVVYEIQQSVNDWRGSDEDAQASGGSSAKTVDEGPISKRPGSEKKNADGRANP
jgi:hypothetical protein